MSTPLTKSNPIWLARQDPDDPNINPHYRRSVMYYRKLYRAWPDYLAYHPGYKIIYKEAAQRREQGEDVNVDHIVPISHPHVSGLHVPWNLEVITALANGQKSNHWWPDMWNEQRELEL